MNSSPSLFQQMMAAAVAAVADGDLSAALRYADRARRMAPDQPDVVLFQGRLLRRIGQADAALSLLDRTNHLPCQIEAAAACRELGNLAAALDRCRDLLDQHPVPETDGLAELAGGVAAAAGLPGWVGVDLLGTIRGTVLPLQPVLVTIADLVMTVVADRDGRFALIPSTGLPGGVLSVTVLDQPVLGSGRLWPPPFPLRGWVLRTGDQVEGWAQSLWQPDWRGPIRLQVGGETVASLSPQSDGHFVGAIPGGLSGAVTALVDLPGGAVQPLLGSGLDPVEPPRSARPPAGTDEPVAPIIDLIVPVYGAAADVETCLAALFATTDRARAEIVVVDDASPDPVLRARLQELAGQGRITLLAQPRNQGFAAAANRGFALHPDRDVVLLNSDTEVFGDWLGRLARAAATAPDWGTITPWSNAGAILTYPGGPERPIASAEAATLDRLAARVHPGLVVDLPTGIGYCLYLKRTCLTAVGVFEAGVFGRGYGEESDFCRRAAAAGWRHGLAADVYIRHKGGASFSDTAASWRARNRRVMALRHPDYEATVQAFLADDPLRTLRRALDEARLADLPHPVLLVGTTPTGGVRAFIDRHQQELAAEGETPLLLGAADTPGRVRISDPSGHLQDLDFALPAESGELARLLGGLGLERIEIHHFLDLPPSILDLVSQLGRPIEAWIHDYAWFCPRVTLIDGDGRYCEEPAVEACERCIARNGRALAEPLRVADLRERSARLLRGARRVVVATEDGARRVRRYVPDLRPVILPWEPPAALPPQRVRPPAGARLRVGVIGAIGFQKGYDLLLACARAAAAEDLPLEFSVIGFSDDDAALMATGRVFVTGRYRTGEVAGLIEREAPDLLFFPARSPETWSFGLSEALATGLPIAAFDIGAIGERLRRLHRGRLIPLTSGPAAVNQILIRAIIRARVATGLTPVDPGRPEPLLTPPSRRPTIPPASKPTGPSSSQPSGTATMPPTPSTAAADPLSVSGQIIALPPGLYSFTVTGGAAKAPNRAGIWLPAAQVALAPAEQTGTVAFLSASAGASQWLRQAGDCLVAQIAGGNAVLMVTSVRSPDGGVLAVDVRRLDGMAALAPTPAVQKPTAKPAVPTIAPGAAPSPPASLRTRPITPGVVPVRAVALLQTLGETAFEEEDWIGRTDQDLAIEALTLDPRDPLSPDLIDYRVLGTKGGDSDWTRGGKVARPSDGGPLAGISIRLRPPASLLYDCIYRGIFRSGRQTEPVRNGAFCRSPVPQDVLIGLSLRIVERATDLGGARS